MGNETNAELVALALQARPAAFEELVRRHFRAAYAVALAVLGVPADAEDVAQESFAAAFERLETCREPERFAGWLVQIVRRRALNALEAAKARGRAAERLAAEPGDAAPPAGSGERDRLVAALESITPAQREVVLLHDLDGWTHPEIAQALGISEVMSRQHLFQSRRTLRGLLGDAAPVEKEERHEQR